MRCCVILVTVTRSCGPPANRYKDARDTLDDARDGPIEGGTWEHRARAREMADTAAKAAMLTLAARQKAGKAHHVGK